jgi:hypothetical protein
MLKNEDLLSIKGQVELESKGYIVINVINNSFSYETLLLNGYIEKMADQLADSKSLKYRITSQGKPYLKLYDNNLWIKPHAVNKISELLKL